MNLQIFLGKILLEIVLANWPELMEPWRTKGTPCLNLSSESIKEARKANINIITQLSDGHGYVGRGWGITTAGTSAFATHQMIRMKGDIRRFEKIYKAQVSSLEGENLYEFHLVRIDSVICVECKSLNFLDEFYRLDRLVNLK